MPTTLDRQTPPRPGKARAPWGVWLLSVATLGIYAWIHHYTINRELREFGIDVNPRISAIAFFPGGLLIIPCLVSIYRTGSRIAVAQETEELEPTAVAVLSAVTFLLALLSVPYHQDQLNKIWAHERLLPARPHPFSKLDN